MPIPKSFIKSVAFKIESGYKLNNAPFSDEDCNNNKSGKYFIGRRLHRQKFIKFLKDDIKGIFLVTGERGVGKTSFVNHVLQEYKNDEEKKEKICIPCSEKKQTKKHERIKIIKLTLSQSKPKELDILWLMVSSVYDEFNKFIKNTPCDLIEENAREKYTAKTLLLGAIAICLFPLFLIWKSDDRLTLNFKHVISVDFFKTYNYFTEQAIFLTLLVCFILFLIAGWYFLFCKRREANILKDPTPQNRIIQLRDRCNALLTEETGGEDELNVEGLSGFLFGKKEKTTKQYAIANTKEIEYELQQFLKDVEKYCLEFIFIFDELDKIDPVVGASYLYEDLENSKKTENANPLDLRERKQAIINIIAGLKNFFTTAKARFIFIAGHEMFDAALADIADRQSSISSIFTYVFYIESFLKEKDITGSNNSPSLSAAIEEYLKWMFFGIKSSNHKETQKTEPGNNTDEQNLDLFKLLINCISKNNSTLSEEELNREKVKIISVLQNFITYLVYRSNGSPKKLIKIIHEFILVKNTGENWPEGKKDKVICVPLIEKSETENSKSNNDKKEKQLFLYFNYSGQYRIGFISYLYRPFLIQYGRSFKQFSDNIIISTPYLFDHLIKFHPFAFSLSNLELIPEVLSTSKTPSLHEHLRNIIDYLGENHIRKTDVKLFDYKFYSRTLNEITYISKIFEEEAAAFNFTLDESYLVKIHIKQKIREQRSIYSKFSTDIKESGTSQIFSIAHLNGILGDLHFFDREYDDSIVAYSDSIRSINNIKITEMSLREFTTLFRNKLKLGLCFEKTNSFEQALAFYADCSQDAKRFMMFRLLESKEISEYYPFENKYVYQSSSLIDILQMIIQGFLATIIIEEKMGMEGMTPKKTDISLGNFLNLAVITNDKLGNTESKQLVFANAFLLMGKLFYFKNTPANIEGRLSFHHFYQFPAAFKTKLEILYLLYYTGINKRKEFFREPTMAEFMYIIGIYEIVAPQLNVLQYDFKEKDTAFEKLLRRVEKFLDTNNQILLGHHYRYIATFLSSIGDCILSRCKKNRSSYKEIRIENLFKQDEIFGFEKRYNDEIIKLQKIYNKETDSEQLYNELNKILNFESYVVNEDETELNLVFKCYYLSGRFFLKYGKSVSCSYQYRKILSLLKTIIQTTNLYTFLKVDNSPVYKKPVLSDLYKWFAKASLRKAVKHTSLQTAFANFLDKTIVAPALEIVSENSHRTDRHMIKKMESLVVNASKSFILGSISDSPESKEIILLFNYIKLKLGINPGKNINDLVSNYNGISTQYSRLLELEYHAKYVFDFEINKQNKIRNNNYQFQIDDVKESASTGASVKEESPSSTVNTNNSNYDIIKVDIQSIETYLFNMYSMLRILNIYGNDFLIGYSSFAYTHYRLALFIKKIRIKDVEIIKGRLRDLMGISHIALDATYHFQQAKDLYEKAVQLHTAGNEYKKNIGDMIYLEDDFSDNAYHFGAALTRYLIINKDFTKKIQECQFEIKNDKYYSSGAY